MDINRPIYLDNLSTTPVDSKVIKEMLPYFNEKFGNEGSQTHLYGWEAKESVELARERISKLIKCNINEIYFTSGATESINLALKGLAYSKKNTKKHIITFTTEHKATIDVCKKLHSEGYEVTYLPVDADGNIDLNLLENSITEQTFLVTVLHANNEIGNIYPVKNIGEICKRNNVFFHVDAAQTVGKIDISIKDMDIDLLSFSSHKIYGPKGVGALYIKKINSQIDLEPIIHGGGQEDEIRPGTLAVQNIVGFGKACEICLENLEYDDKRILKLRNKLLNDLLEIIPDIKVNGDLKNRLAGNLNITIPNIKNTSLMMSLRNIAISNGSACTSNSIEPSHVLKAIGLSTKLSNSSIRFGIGRFNTIDEIDYTVQKINKTIMKLRSL